MKITVLGHPVPLGRPRFRVIRKGKANIVMTYPAPSSAKWTETVRNMAKMQLDILELTPLRGPIKVTLHVTPGLTKAGKPAKRIGDLDNHLKGVLDALNGVAFVDDSQMRESHAYMNEASKTPGIVVEIQPL